MPGENRATRLEELRGEHDGRLRRKPPTLGFGFNLAHARTIVLRVVRTENQVPARALGWSQERFWCLRKVQVRTQVHEQ